MLQLHNPFDASKFTSKGTQRWVTNTRQERKNNDSHAVNNNISIESNMSNYHILVSTNRGSGSVHATNYHVQLIYTRLPRALYPKKKCDINWKLQKKTTKLHGRKQTHTLTIQLNATQTMVEWIIEKHFSAFATSSAHHITFSSEIFPISQKNAIR